MCCDVDIAHKFFFYFFIYVFVFVLSICALIRPIRTPSGAFEEMVT